jgi:hypothetical protein
MRYLCTANCFDRKGNRYKAGDIVEYGDNDYVSKWFEPLEREDEADDAVLVDEQENTLVEKEPETLSELQKIIMPPEPFTQPEPKEEVVEKKAVKKVTKKASPKKAKKK